MYVLRGAARIRKSVLRGASRRVDAGAIQRTGGRVAQRAHVCLGRAACRHERLASAAGMSRPPLALVGCLRGGGGALLLYAQLRLVHAVRPRTLRGRPAAVAEKRDWT